MKKAAISTQPLAISRAVQCHLWQSDSDQRNKSGLIAEIAKRAGKSNQALAKDFLGVLRVLGVKLILMNVDQIRAFCLSFPHATEKLQWEDNLCFKIAGKIFAMLGLDNPRLCFKCSPEIFSELTERENIRPAPYVGRYKWVMLDRLDALSDEELEDSIRQSYEMVAAKAPKISRKAQAPKKAQGARKRKRR